MVRNIPQQATDVNTLPLRCHNLPRCEHKIVCVDTKETAHRICQFDQRLIELPAEQRCTLDQTLDLKSRELELELDSIDSLYHKTTKNIPFDVFDFIENNRGKIRLRE